MRIQTTPVIQGIVIGTVFYFVFIGLPSWIADHPPRALVMFHGFIQFVTFLAFFVAMALLRARQKSSQNEERAFSLGILPAEEETLLLPEDALEQRKKLKLLDKSQRSFILVKLLEAGLQRARANWSAEDAGTAVKTASELIAEESESAYSLIRYLAWAIPSIGFIGTVLGIGEAMGAMKEAGKGDLVAMAAPHLAMAFDTTFVALLLSLIMMFYLHHVQSREDGLLTRATEYCLRNFVFRMHIPKQTGGNAP